MLALGVEEIKGYKAIGPNAQLEACGWCGGVWDAADKSNPRLLKCSGCKGIYYCSKNCQALHWPKHTSTCQLSTKERDEQRRVQALGTFTEVFETLQEVAGVDLSQVDKEWKDLRKKKKRDQSKSS